MKQVIATNSTGGLAFLNPAILSKLTKAEFIVLNGLIMGKVLMIVISSYVPLPKLTGTIRKSCSNPLSQKRQSLEIKRMG